MYWDAHCHLTDPKVYSKVEAYLAEALSQNIGGFCLGGVDSKDWQRQAELKKQYPEKIRTSFGIHPWVVSRLSGEALKAEWELFESSVSENVGFGNERAVCDGVGETGLDFGKRFESKQKIQEEWFERHLELSDRLNLPLVLHCVHAHKRVLEILSSLPLPRRGLVHAFSGDYATSKKYIDLGFLISIGSRLLNPKASALHDTVSRIPLETLVIETDYPDQPPADSGYEHGPKTLFQIAEKVSELRAKKGWATEVSQILSQSRDNLLSLFP